MEIGVYNFNNLQPIENVTVIVENESQVINQSITDGLGAVTLSASSPSNRYNITVDKSGYIGQRFENETVSDQTYLFYLVPLNENGIIKLVYSDRTFQDHELCIFFHENGRLKGCYRSDRNETIFLTTNTEYDFNVRLTQVDLLSSPSKFRENSWILFPIIFVIIVVGGLLGIIVFLTYKSIKNRRGKNG